MQAERLRSLAGKGKGQTVDKKDWKSMKKLWRFFGCSGSDNSRMFQICFSLSCSARGYFAICVWLSHGVLSVYCWSWDHSNRWDHWDLVLWLQMVRIHLVATWSSGIIMLQVDLDAAAFSSWKEALGGRVIEWIRTMSFGEKSGFLKFLFR